MRPQTGLILSGRFELTHRIAVGGMGEVWRGEDKTLGRVVAVKILKEEYTGDPGFLERFRAEARHTARLNHPGIANVFDYGEEDGSAYLVMELVPGEPLSSVLEREKMLSPEFTLSILAQTGRALEVAHSQGLVHRDIKPGNLLVTPEGRIKITDFGIARIADQVPLTATGQVMGTAQYLAPEQAVGQTATGASDIYALGVIAYEALAGYRPFSGESPIAVAMAQVNDQPAPLPGNIPSQIRALVMSMLEKDPKRRPQNGDLLATAADALRVGDTAVATAAVPQMLDRTSGTGTATTVLPVTNQQKATEAMGAVGSPTSLLPAEQTADDYLFEEEANQFHGRSPRRKKKSPWVLVTIILAIIIILSVIAFLLFSLFNKSDDSPAPATSSPPSSASSSPPSSRTRSAPSTTPSQQTSEAGQTVTVDPLDYLGRQYNEVRAALIRLDLQVTGFPVQDSQGRPPGTVIEINPTGRLLTGSSVYVTYVADSTKEPEPEETNSGEIPSNTPSGGGR